MEKSKKLQALSRKKDFALLKNQGLEQAYKWLKACFLSKDRAEDLKVAWILPKKHISLAPVRNRLKRWGRENLRQSSLKGLLLLYFCRKGPGFYKKLSRKDFDYVFSNLLEKVRKKT